MRFGYPAHVVVDMRHVVSRVCLEVSARVVITENLSEGVLGGLPPASPSLQPPRNYPGFLIPGTETWILETSPGSWKRVLGPGNAYLIDQYGRLLL